MRKGISPIYEKNLEELMALNKERLTYTSNYKKAYQEADVILIGVGTPENADGSANLTYIYTVLDQIIESIVKDVVVVIKSTVPIGTNDRIEEYLNSKLQNITVSVASNPEFLAQGSAVHDTLYANRIIVGAEDERAKKVMSIGLITAAALIPAKPVPSPAPIPAKKVTRIVIRICCISNPPISPHHTVGKSEFDFGNASFKMWGSSF